MKQYKICACCGGFAGYWEQYPNQDTGRGVCMDCVEWLSARFIRQGIEPTAEIARRYGELSINFGPTTVTR